MDKFHGVGGSVESIVYILPPNRFSPQVATGLVSPRFVLLAASVFPTFRPPSQAVNIIGANRSGRHTAQSSLSVIKGTSCDRGSE